MLLSRIARPVVVVVFVGWLFSSIAVLPMIEIGLDQELSMPEDSYLQKYFEVSLASKKDVQLLQLAISC